MEGALKVLLHKPWLRHAAASLLLAILVSSLTLLFASDQGGLPIYYEGVLSFWADYDAVFLPAGLNGLYFDTSDCEGCHDTLAAWRFRDSLLIKGLLLNGQHRPLVDSTQLDNVVLASPELTALLKRLRAVYLLRAIPQRTPYDTLVWNRASKSYKVVKDGAQFFDLRFPPYVDLELALVDLKAIKGISHRSRIPIPYPDAASE